MGTKVQRQGLGRHTAIEHLRGPGTVLGTGSSVALVTVGGVLREGFWACLLYPSKTHKIISAWLSW